MCVMSYRGIYVVSCMLMMSEKKNWREQLTSIGLRLTAAHDRASLLIRHCIVNVMAVVVDTHT